MTMITPSYLGETIEYSSLHACRSTLEDPTYLTGYCFQADPTWDCPTLQNALAAILQVFSTTINGRTGQPGDLVALEYAATNRYGGTETEAQAQLQGVEAISTRGPLAVQGFGNGGPNV